MLTESMQVVVLLGGRGTRLKSRLSELPKPMVDVSGRPFFEYQFELMRSAGFKKFLFCVGYLGEIIESHFGDGSSFGVSISYASDGEKLLGTGGALRRASAMLEKDFILVYGDSYMDIDYEEVVYRFRNLRPEGEKALMVVFRNSGRYDRSNVVFHDGLVTTYDKNAEPSIADFIDYGVLVLHRDMILSLPEGEPNDIAGLLSHLATEKRLAGLEVKRRFFEIGTPPALAEFTGLISSRFASRRKAAIFDRDGTINALVFNDSSEQIESPLEPSELRLLPGAVEGMKALRDMGYLLVIATNQPAAAKGKTSLGKLFDINHALEDMLAERGVHIDDILMCPHFPEASENTRETFLICKCQCRKPRPGLLERAVAKYNLDRRASLMIGDSHTDILAGAAAGFKTVFLGRYKCDTCQLLGDTKPDYTVKYLPDLATELKE